MPKKSSIFLVIWLFSLAIILAAGNVSAQLNINALKNESPWLSRQEGLRGESGVGKVAYDSVTPKDPRLIVVELIKIFLGLLGIICVVMIIIGGFYWMTAGGNEDKVITGRKFIINAALGLLIILASYAITLYVSQRILCATRDLYCSSSFWREIGNP